MERQDRRWNKKIWNLKATSNGLRQQSFARRAEIKVSCTSNVSLRWCYVQHWNQVEISQVTFGFNKDREGIEHLNHVDLWSLLSVSQCLLKSHLSFLASNIYFVLNSAKVKKKWKCDSEKLFEWKLVVSFVLYYLRSRFFRKGFDVNCQKFN